MSFNSLKRDDKQKLVAIYTKSVGSAPVTRPTFRGSGMPICLNEQRRSPRIVYKRQENIKSIRLFADSVMNIHLMDVFVALMFDELLELPDSERSSTKRQVRLSYI